MQTPNDALIQIYRQAYEDVLGRLVEAAAADRSIAYYHASATGHWAHANGP